MMITEELLKDITNRLQLIQGRIGKAKERIDTAESELNKLIQEIKTTTEKEAKE